MSRSLLLSILLLGCEANGLTAAAELHPQDFAYGITVETPNAATAYRFTLPVEVFTKVAHQDLRDLRMFNGAGTVVPYELRQASQMRSTRAQGQPLPVYPLHADARATLNGIRVTIHSQGTAVDLQTGAATQDPRDIASYVLDARGLARPISGLQLHWPDGAPEFSGNVRIDSSDDLGSWRVVGSELPVVHLLTGNSELTKSLLEFPSTKAKFWRLTWVGKTAPFELTSVTEATLAEQLTPQSSITVKGSRVSNRESDLSFDLGANLPVTQISLALPDANSVLSVELYSRARSADTWRLVTQAEFFRVSTGSSDRNNHPVRIPTDSDRFWLARQIRPTGAIGDVKLQATWDAMEVVFLARGPGPFLLAYGNGSAGSSTVALASLVEGAVVAHAQVGSSHLLGGTDRLRPAPKTVPWRMTVLWLVLGLGVVLLAWMTYRLSKDLSSRATGDK